MRKRCFFVLVIFIASLLSSGIHTISAKADETSELFEIDDAMVEFMLEHDLPNIAVPIDCGLEVVYEQFSEDGGGFSISGTEAISENYGLSANVAAYQTGTKNVLLYLDIRFSMTADVSESDVLRISCPNGILSTDTNPPVQLLLLDQLGVVLGSVDFTASTSDSKTIQIPLNEILAHSAEILNKISSFVPENPDARILLYISGTAPDSQRSALQNMTVIWQKNVLTNESAVDSNLIFQDMEVDVYKDKNTIPWKMIMVIFVVIFDVVILFVLIRLWRKNAQKRVENGPEKNGLSDTEISDMEAELSQNLKLKPEDIEYLRSIGYFDPDKK